jgi:hypothetical protein
MASPNATFTELVSTTFRNHGKTFVDNTSRNNVLYAMIMEKGNAKTVEDGGLTIVEPLDYEENSTYQRYSGYDLLNVSASDVLTSAEFQWRQVALNVVANGRELRINSGKSRIINLARSRIKNALRTFRNNFSFDIYSDGTLSNQINGLQALVSDTGLGTVGGIDSSTWAFWQSRVQSAAAPLQGGGAVTVSATTMESDMMLPLYMALTRGDDQPDLIVMSNDYFRFYEASQVSLKRYASESGPQTGKGGFLTLWYKKAKVVFDGGSGIPTSRGYFLNTDYLGIVAHSDANLSVLDEAKPYNQDASVTPILWMGNMYVSNRSLQGVMKP